jgi:transcriptional regulator with XRE-family HTH domain
MLSIRKLLKVKELQAALGERIRELRRKKGFSQEAFADHCGLHRTYMGGIERGEHNLTVQTALTVARGLGITLSRLFSNIESSLEDPAGTQRAE